MPNPTLTPGDRLKHTFAHSLGVKQTKVNDFTLIHAPKLGHCKFLTLTSLPKRHHRTNTGIRSPTLQNWLFYFSVSAQDHAYSFEINVSEISQTNAILFILLWLKWEKKIEIITFFPMI